MTMIEMSSKHATATGHARRHFNSAKLSVSRKVSDDELWQRLDQKLAERDNARKGDRELTKQRSFFSRVIRGMGFRGV